MAAVVRTSLVLLGLACLAVGAKLMTPKQVQLCMMNCGQCKEMWGDYFDGPRCAEFCLAIYKSESDQVLPDCNAPETVDEFFIKDAMAVKPYQPQQSPPVSQALMGRLNPGQLSNIFKSAAFSSPRNRNYKKRLNGKSGLAWYLLE